MNDKKPGSILCIGIAVLDIVVRPVLDPSLWKEKQGIESIQLLCGGDAANQSIHLASLGYHTFLNGCIGEDTNGATVKTALAERGVDVSLLRVKPGASTGTALLLVNAEGERTVFSMRGAHRMLSCEDLPSSLPEDCRAVSIGSLFGMPSAECEGLEELLKEAEKRKIPVFADLDSGRVRNDLTETGIGKLLPYVDYLLPSHYDLETMTGRKSMEEAVDFLKDHGVREVIVKCGAKGAKIFGESFRGEVSAAAVSPVDTTGAGDCMTAAFVSRIIEGDDLRSACRYACAAGSLSTLYLGANTVVLQDEDIREMMSQIPD